MLISLFILERQFYRKIVIESTIRFLTWINVTFQEECSENMFLECDLDTNLMEPFYGVL